MHENFDRALTYMSHQTIVAESSSSLDSRKLVTESSYNLRMLLQALHKLLSVS
jgi:hypothetical protein